MEEKNGSLVNDKYLCILHVEVLPFRQFFLVLFVLRSMT